MMKLLALLSVTLVGLAAIWPQNRAVDPQKNAASGEKPAAVGQAPASRKTSAAPNPSDLAIERGAKWLASVQGSDGGWGQDGGDPSYVRKNVPLESNGNDVANTAIAALALLRAGNQYKPNVERAVAFILQRVEASPAEGLLITDSNQHTQVQRKLGPFIDTFVASMVLAQVDGTLPKLNARIRSGLEKCVGKIERNQTTDGSWNTGGGWAPILGTSLASRSLDAAQQKGVKVNQSVIARADAYTLKSQKERDSTGDGRGLGAGRGAVGATESVTLMSVSAGVGLYQDAQALEQLSRTKESQQKNAKEIADINGRLSDPRFVEGYGSIGGEEFFSYLNIGDSLRRLGGKEWSDWHSKITAKILKLQNEDGTWAGQHCITGRVAVTSAAIMNLTTDIAD